LCLLELSSNLRNITGLISNFLKDNSVSQNRQFLAKKWIVS
jgi:hypothetical protein